MPLLRRDAFIFSRIPELPAISFMPSNSRKHRERTGAMSMARQPLLSMTRYTGSFRIYRVTV